MSWLVLAIEHTRYKKEAFSERKQKRQEKILLGQLMNSPHLYLLLDLCFLLTPLVFLLCSTKCRVGSGHSQFLRGLHFHQNVVISF